MEDQDSKERLAALTTELEQLTAARKARKETELPQAVQYVKDMKAHVANIRAALKAETDEEEKAKGTAALQESEATLKAAEETVTAMRAAEKDDVARGKEIREQMKEVRKAAKDAGKEPRIEQNGQAKPRPGTISDKLWSIFDEVSAQLGRPAAIGDVFERATGEGIKEASVRAGYAHWRRFHGITGRVMSQAELEAKAAAEKEAAEKAAAKAAADAAKANEPA